MTMKKKPSWMIVLAALVFCVFMSTALGEASNGKQETAEVENPVRAVCENGVMLGRCEQGVISFKGGSLCKAAGRGSSLESTAGTDSGRQRDRML